MFMGVRVFKFVAEPASRADADEMWRIIKLGEQYGRVLVDIENQRRERARAICLLPMKDVPEDERPAWREANQGVLDAWNKSAERNELLKETGKWKNDQISRGGARSRRGDLHHGTYSVIVEAAHKMACRKNGCEPLRYKQNRRVGCDITTRDKRTAGDVMDRGHPWLTIGSELYALERSDGNYRSPAPAGAVNRSGDVRPAKHRLVRLRVSKDRWVGLHVLMHRQIPRDAIITGAYAHVERVGTRDKWSVAITVDEPDRRRATEGTGTVGVDVGWRRVPGGTRVGFWYGSDGAHGEIVVSDKIEARKLRSEGSAAERDRLKNRIADLIGTFRDEHPGTWLDEDAQQVRSWRKERRFFRLIRKWTDNRILGDDDVYAELAAWVPKENRLHNHQDHAVRKGQREREGMLASAMHDLARRYGVIAIEDMNMSDMKEMDNAAHGKAFARVAPGSVHAAIKKAAQAHGAQVHVVDPAYTSMRCSSCRVIRNLADRSASWLVCHACGVGEDRDMTGAKNIMAASIEARDDAGNLLAPAKPRTARKISKRAAGKAQAGAGTGRGRSQKAQQPGDNAGQ